MVASYFMRISPLRDQLQAIGESIDETKLVTTTLNGLPDSWDAFASSSGGRTKIPSID